MGAMQLEHVEAAAFAALGRRHESVPYCVHAGAIELARNLTVGEIRQRRCREHLPAALLERTIHAVPHQLRRTLAPGVAQLQADFCG
ncbi:hypothetical protein ACVWXM_006843 [Bradyrhizobium sp. GM7.3]